MAGYHLWHPAYVIAEPLTLEAFITLGDAFLPPRRDAQAVLAALDLNVKTRGATLDPIRTHYFSSYRDSGDWEDRWAPAWRLRATLLTERAPTLPNEPLHFGYDGAPDPPADEHEWRCLVIAHADDDDTIEAAAHAVEDADCLRAEASGHRPQLRCDLGVRTQPWYESGAPEAEALLRALSAAGASTSATA